MIATEQDGKWQHNRLLAAVVDFFLSQQIDFYSGVFVAEWLDMAISDWEWWAKLPRGLKPDKVDRHLKKLCKSGFLQIKKISITEVRLDDTGYFSPMYATTAYKVIDKEGLLNFAKRNFPVPAQPTRANPPSTN